MLWGLGAKHSRLRDQVSVPYRNSFGSQRPLNTRSAAQTFRVSRVCRELASHVIAASYAPPVEDEPERIDHAELGAKRILLMLQLVLDVRKAPLVVDASALLDRRVILFVRSKSLGTKQLRVRYVDSIRRPCKQFETTRLCLRTAGRIEACPGESTSEKLQDRGILRKNEAIDLQSRDAALGIDGEIFGRVVGAISCGESPELERLTGFVQHDVRRQPARRYSLRRN